MHDPVIAVLAAALAAWVFGAIWYTALGRTWMAASGLSAEEIERHRAARKMPLLPMAICFICEIVMALLLVPLLGGMGVSNLGDAALIGFLLGLGFLATSGLVNNSFQGRSLKLSAIDGAHWAIVLTIEAVVLTVLV